VFFKKSTVCNLSFLLSKSLLVMFIGFSVLNAAHAQISEEKAFAVKKTVQSQLAAFAADDAKLAFSFAAPGIQKLFKTPDNFMTMVQQAYPVIYRPANILFLKAKILDSVAEQPVRLWDQVGDVWLAAYNLERQADGSWLITACVLMRDKSAVDLTTNQSNIFKVNQ
jgi:hypothetical protein